jgi:hypothetical protein
MHFLRYFIAAGVAALIAISSVQAKEHSGKGKHCCKTGVLSVEKHLQDIRGTICITGLTRNASGQITAIQLEARRGSGYTIENIIVNQTNVAPLLGPIFGTSVLGAQVFELSFDVNFNCPFKDDPSTVLTIEDAAGSLGTTTALVNSLTLVVNNVSKNGFTANLFVTAYGVSPAAINDLLALVFNPQVGPCLNFISQAK